MHVKKIGQILTENELVGNTEQLNNDGYALVVHQPDIRPVKMLSHKGGEVSVKLDVNQLATENKRFIATYVYMLRELSGTDSEMQGIVFNMSINRVTIAEAMIALREASKDEYLSGGVIRFHNLWKPIRKLRYGLDGRLYTHSQALNWLHERELGYGDMELYFEMTNYKLKNGKNGWKRIQ